jgi:regulation of enolase protein 1 (concanavalin A-like superfamily)
LQRRTSTGGDTTRTASGSGDAPAWLRLVREGSSFTAYRSTDGRSWTTIATATISMPATVYVGLAVASRDAAQLAGANFTNLRISPALPAPWKNRDVGSPVRAGTAASSAPGTFSVTGAGEAIWGSADQFQYVYQPIQGDTEITARVASLQVTHAGAKAGVMVRESLNTGARYAAMFATGSNGWSFQYRDVTDGWSFVSAGSGGTAPGWVRLVRAGDRLTGYQSTDGKSWSVVGSETIDMSSSVYVGLAVSSRVATVPTAATFTNVAVSKGSSSSNAPPTVSIASPAASATYTAPASMTVTATASDSDGTVARVDIYQGSTLLKSDTTVPYSVAWDGVGPGTYQLTAVARDNDGATKTSAAVTVTIRSASNQAPSVSISSPASGASFTAQASIAIQATAGDADGRVTRVEFYRGTTLIGSDSTAPYSVTWTGAAVGAYTLTAKAFDEDGASRTSSGVSVSVNGATSRPTRVVFVPSANSATSVTSYTVALYRASDPITASPVTTRNLGKPAVVSGEISVDISTLVNPLAAGSYYAVVRAVGPGGTTPSAKSANFTK